MGVVIAFPLSDREDQMVVNHPEYDSRINHMVPKERVAFLKWAKSILTEEDYLAVLEGISCYELFVDLEEDLQTLVLGFINIKA